MKNLLTTVVTSAFATLLFNVGLTLFQDHRTVWQYDHWRAVYRTEQERRARAAWLAAEFARTNKDPAWQWLGGGPFCITNRANGFFYGINSIDASEWTTTIRLGTSADYNNTKYAPNFNPGELELGFRSDGTVTFRKPPELEPKLTLHEAAEKGKQKVMQAVTNL